MKIYWVATRIAGKIKALFQTVSDGAKAFFLISLLFCLSCSKDDDSTENNDAPEVPESIIIYTNMEPDFNSNSQNLPFELDVNNDQVVDFTIKVLDENWAYLLEIKSNSDNTNGMVSVHPWYANPLPLEDGFSISEERSLKKGSYSDWGIFTIQDCFGGETGCLGDWKDKGDRYLGIRIEINNKLHYGWVRMQIESNTQWIVKEYAYNATPGIAILAGQTE